MKESILNAIILIIALLLLALAWHCLTLAWTVTNGNGTLYLIIAFILGAVGVGILIYLITSAKD